MRGPYVVRIQQGRGGSFVGGACIRCLCKHCGTQDERDQEDAERHTACQFIAKIDWLLQRYLYIRRRLHAACSRNQRDIPWTEACGNSQIDLVQPGA